jgi:hypothetical protein
VADERQRPETGFERNARRRRELARAWRPSNWTTGLRGPRAKPTAGGRPADMPPVEPSLDRQIDDALRLLGSVPFEELQRRGWHFQPNHFHWPLNDVPFLRAHPELWTQPALPAEIDWNLDGQLELLKGIARYAGELDDVPAGAAPPGEFAWDAGPFPRGDATLYYCLVRHLRPRRVVEVGAGWSSLILRRALEANGDAAHVTLVEPDPNCDVLRNLPPAWELIETQVQFAGFDCFEALRSGDVLFYDGSHCVHTGSDVNWIFFNVLPRLSAGVWIHVHDLMWPWDYPPEWVLDEGLSWNEQYLVQAFLMGNDRYRVRLSLKVLGTRVRNKEVEAIIRGPLHGSSVWIQKVDT